MSIPFLRSFEALDAALHAGSFKRAADRLAITPAAVGQRIKALEEHLGVTLILRTRSGLLPSAELAHAAPHLERAFAELAQATELLEAQRANELRVAGAADWVELWLRPRLPSFRDAYPNMEIRLARDGDANAPFARSDVEIRFGPPKGDGEEDFLFRDFLIPVGTPESVNRLAHPPHNGTFEGFPLLHLDFYRDDPAAPTWNSWSREAGMWTESAVRGLRFKRVGPVLESVLTGAGFAIAGLSLLRPHLEDGRVTLPFPVETGTWTDHGFTARFRPSSRAKAPVRKFRNWLLEEAAATTEWLEDIAAGR